MTSSIEEPHFSNAQQQLIMFQCNVKQTLNLNNLFILIRAEMHWHVALHSMVWKMHFKFFVPVFYLLDEALSDHPGLVDAIQRQEPDSEPPPGSWLAGCVPVVSCTGKLPLTVRAVHTGWGSIIGNTLWASDKYTWGTKSLFNTKLRFVGFVCYQLMSFLSGKYHSHAKNKYKCQSWHFRFTRAYGILTKEDLPENLADLTWPH